MPRLELQMDPAWIALAGGLSGVLIGSGLTEYFRRASRIETYSAAIFERRLSIYEAPVQETR